MPHRYPPRPTLAALAAFGVWAGALVAPAATSAQTSPEESARMVQARRRRIESRPADLLKPEKRQRVADYVRSMERA